MGIATNAPVGKRGNGTIDGRSLRWRDARSQGQTVQLSLCMGLKVQQDHNTAGDHWGATGRPRHPRLRRPAVSACGFLKPTTGGGRAGSPSHRHGVRCIHRLARAWKTPRRRISPFDISGTRTGRVSFPLWEKGSVLRLAVQETSVQQVTRTRRPPSRKSERLW